MKPTSRNVTRNGRLIVKEKQTTSYDALLGLERHGELFEIREDTHDGKGYFKVAWCQNSPTRIVEKMTPIAVGTKYRPDDSGGVLLGVERVLVRDKRSRLHRSCLSRMGFLLSHSDRRMGTHTNNRKE